MMVVDLSTRIYTPLSPSSIRILTLEPGKAKAAIYCSLTEIPLHSADNPTYEALSYMWGPPEPTETITLNGHQHVVRQNLFTALKALRDKKRPRIMWIDALCINQSDVRERSSQVAIMSTVYSKAVRVIAWLGEGGKDTAKLVNFLNDTKGHWEQAYRKIPQFYPLNYARRTLRSLAWERLSGADFEDSLDKFCNHPYWSRVWIIQEILSASSVVILCGSKLLDMKYLAAASSAADRGYEVEFPGISLAKQYAQHLHTGETQGASLWDLLTLCQSCNSQCEDPRDKIYGLLSLANDNTNLVPDYSKSTLHLYIELINSGQIPITRSEIDRLQTLLHPYDDASLAGELWNISPDTALLMMLTYLGDIELAGAEQLLIHPSKIVIDSSEPLSCPYDHNFDSLRWTLAVPESLIIQCTPPTPATCSCDSTAPLTSHWGNLQILYTFVYDLEQGTPENKIPE